MQKKKLEEAGFRVLPELSIYIHPYMDKYIFFLYQLPDI
jgi:hypothetical protein